MTEAGRLKKETERERDEEEGKDEDKQTIEQPNFSSDNILGCCFAMQKSFPHLIHFAKLYIFLFLS